jgi:hypothetical protein
MGVVRDSRCPECGATLRLSLTARRSTREAVSGRLWLIGLVGPCTAVDVLTLDLARVAINVWVGSQFLGGPGLWTIWNRLLLFAGALMLMYVFLEMRESVARQHPLVAMLLAVNQYVFV